MYLTAQRVVSPSGENGINGFLYKHDVVAWDIPPEAVTGSVGELVHAFIVVPQGGNNVMSYVDVVAPDGTPYDRIRTQISSWMMEQASAQLPLPWTGVTENIRFGLHMVSTYAKDWRREATQLLMACQMTIDEYRCTAK